MIKNGWDDAEQKAAQQQPVAAAQLFMHLFLSLLSFTFQFLCCCVLHFRQRSEQGMMDKNA